VTPRRAFLQVAPWILAGSIALLATLTVIAFALGYTRAAFGLLGVMCGSAALGFVFLALPWLILWPRGARPALGAYLAGFARGEPLQLPPGADDRA
jgi:hypothetical protein